MEHLRVWVAPLTQVRQAGPRLVPMGQGLQQDLSIPECLGSALPAPAMPGTGIPRLCAVGILMAPRCMDHPAHPMALGHDAQGGPGVGSDSSRACCAKQLAQVIGSYR